MASDDVAVARAVRRQKSRRSVDASLLDVAVSHGVVYLRGVLRTVRTNAAIDLEVEMSHISTVLRQDPAIRDVHWDVTLRS